jgi:hypothetical protein
MEEDVDSYNNIKYFKKKLIKNASEFLLNP